MIFAFSNCSHVAMEVSPAALLKPYPSGVTTQNKLTVSSWRSPTNIVCGCPEKIDIVAFGTVAAVTSSVE